MRFSLVNLQQKAPFMGVFCIDMGEPPLTEPAGENSTPLRTCADISTIVAKKRSLSLISFSLPLARCVTIYNITLIQTTSYDIMDTIKKRMEAHPCES